MLLLISAQLCCWATIVLFSCPFLQYNIINEMAAEEQDQSDLEKRIIEAFEVFDHAGNKSIDVREVCTIVRSLGCCPTEAEIQEILVAVEDQETSGSVQLDKFLPVMKQIIQENRLQPASPEELLKAFLTLDPENKGYLTKDYLSKAMMEEGEPFTQEELDEMMAIAIDGETGNIPYEYYINQLMVE
ncbi:dynein regulatory complex protein 8 [Schistocerca cancellata]|uniref:dynein regulatory complex protein 8 n=2 Tax=Schistocerca TaxID=7008 RepID=UPI002118353E|nr:dynein regulatory complex protein 8 [Schistocerca cancellata]